MKIEEFHHYKIIVARGMTAEEYFEWLNSPKQKIRKKILKKSRMFYDFFEPFFVRLCNEKKELRVLFYHTMRTLCQISRDIEKCTYICSLDIYCAINEYDVTAYWMELLFLTGNLTKEEYAEILPWCEKNKNSLLSAVKDLEKAGSYPYSKMQKNENFSIGKDILEKAKNFAVKCVKFTEAHKKDILMRDLLEYGIDMCADVAKAESRNFCVDFFSSIYSAIINCDYAADMLRVCFKCEYLTKEEYDLFLSECDDIKDKLTLKWIELYETEFLIKEDYTSVVYDGLHAAKEAKESLISISNELKEEIEYNKTSSERRRRSALIP